MKIYRPPIQRIITAIKTHPRRAIIIAVAFVLIITGIITYIVMSQPKQDKPRKVAEKVKQEPPMKYYAPLTGVEVVDQAATSKPVTAIMLENSPDARPQSGLKEAEVVYEAIAEGGITRFAALYQQNKPELIGPVRSIRPYYIDWVVPYNASFAHSGGSARATQEINSGAHRNIGQPTNAAYYWRATDRFAPHNVYTSSAKLDELNQAKGYTSSSPKGFVRGEATLSETPASIVNVTISSPTFNSSYAYDSASKQYLRSQGGAPHLDREKGQIAASVVIVLNVNETREFQDTTREVITTLGSGPVTIFQNGTVITGTWNRATRDDQYTFVDTTGKPVTLAAGMTWVTAIPNGPGSVTWQ